MASMLVPEWFFSAGGPWPMVLRNRRDLFRFASQPVTARVPVVHKQHPRQRSPRGHDEGGGKASRLAGPNDSRALLATTLAKLWHFLVVASDALVVVTLIVQIFADRGTAVDREPLQGRFGASFKWTIESTR